MVYLLGKSSDNKDLLCNFAKKNWINKFDFEEINDKLIEECINFKIYHLDLFQIKKALLMITYLAINEQTSTLRIKGYNHKIKFKKK